MEEIKNVNLTQLKPFKNHPFRFLHNPKYNVYPVIEFIEKHISKLCEEGVVWAGYFMCL